MKPSNPRQSSFAILLACAALMMSLPSICSGNKVLIDSNSNSEPSTGIKGLHLERSTQVELQPFVLNDSAGFRWDLYRNGTVNGGTNNAYSEAMRMTVNGTNSGNNQYRGWTNKAGDEVEIGPAPVRTREGVLWTRRVKVYNDQPLARFLDIFENTTNQEAALTVRLDTRFNWPISKITTSSGAATIGKDDWAAITEMPNNGNNTPSTLHVFCGRRSRMRPVVGIQEYNVTTSFNLIVPPNGTVILCSFESQGNTADLAKTLKNFRPANLVKDLPPGVRGLIVNYSGLNATPVPEITLTRSEVSDSVVTTNGQNLLGTIVNDTFTVQSTCGKLKLPAASVLGMVGAQDNSQPPLILLTDGQIIAGTVAENIKLSSVSGGLRGIPMASIRQWSYQVSAERPLKTAFKGPLVALRTGELLRLAGGVKLEFHTRHGTLDLANADLLELAMDSSSNGLHRATFVNGSTLAGMLGSELVSLSLAIGDGVKADIDRNQIARITFAAGEKPDSFLSAVTLNNDDMLYGQLTDKSISLATQFGTVQLDPGRIKTIAFEAADRANGWAAVTLWDTSVLRGQIQQDAFGFRLGSGPKLDIAVGQIVKITRGVSAPSDETIQKIRKLVARLGSESAVDRNAAAEELVGLGPDIVPYLRKFLRDSDPQVRAGLGKVIGKLAPSREPVIDRSYDMYSRRGGMW